MMPKTAAPSSTALCGSARMRAFCGVVLLALALMVTPLTPAAAQTLLRDAETERALRELARPVIAAAGLSPSQIRMIVIRDSTPNAFVIDGRAIFLTSGLILKMDRVEMLQAVIAHEVAHIANGHITRRMSNIRAARTVALFGLALSAAVASQSPAAAAGVAAGSQSAAMRSFFAHTRAEEIAADQSGIRYLARANIDPAGMTEVLELFRGQEALSPGRQDPYVRTHPLSADRLRAVKGFVAAFREADKADPTAQYWFTRSKAKLSAFLRNPSWTLRRLKKGDTSDAALVARAVANSQGANGAAAVAAADALIDKRPSDPYAHELKGWALFNARQFSAAVAAYAKAADLAPSEPLIATGYGRALLAAGGNDARALDVLTKARARDPYNPALLRDLAQVQAKLGQRGAASLSTAERYALAGRLKDAAIHAKRATDLLSRGSSGWRRAQDIVNAAETQARRN
ncbi:MAG: M48 family metalloprotease [Pseudomonadota bacterium]